MTGHSIAARTAVALVALVAGAASWEHIASVALAAGEREWVAYSLPVAIDGLIVAGVASLLEDRRSGRIPRMSARVGVVVGVLATLAANVASAEPTWTARLVAVTAPVSFLLSVEILTRSGRVRPDMTLKSQPDMSAGPRPDMSAAAPRPDMSAGPRPDMSAGPDTSAGPDMSAGPRSRPGARTNGHRGPRGRVADIARAHPDITPRRLAELANVSERHARRILSGLSAATES